MATLTTQDGAELHYTVEGKDTGKPPLIFIHGWCSNLKHWERQVEYFQDTHRILRLDRRGMGQSSSPGSGHTPEQHAADIAAIAQHEGFTDAVALAHAGGGPAGITFSQRYPELVRAFVLVDSTVTPGADLDNPTKAADLFYAEMVEKLLAADGESYFRELYASFFGAQADRALVASAVEDASRTPVDIRVKEIKLMASDSATPAAAMQQPTLTIASPWLAAAFPQAASQDYVQSCFKNVELALTIGSGHFVQLEVPDQVNAFINSFVSRLS